MYTGYDYVHTKAVLGIFEGAFQLKSDADQKAKVAHSTDQFK